MLMVGVRYKFYYFLKGSWINKDGMGKNLSVIDGMFGVVAKLKIIGLLVYL